MFIFLCRFAPGGLTLRSAGLKKRKKAPGEKLLALTPLPDDAESGKLLPAWQGKIVGYESLRIIEHHLPRRLAHFKLRRDFLDLRCLLCHRCQEGGHPGF